MATNWFLLVLSSLLCRSTALFSERGNRRGYVIVSVMVSSSGQRWVREKIYDPALNGSDPSTTATTATTLSPSPDKKQAVGKNTKWNENLPE